jgi:hypothetical protein
MKSTTQTADKKLSLQTTALLRLRPLRLRSGLKAGCAAGCHDTCGTSKAVGGP